MSDTPAPTTEPLQNGTQEHSSAEEEEDAPTLETHQQYREVSPPAPESTNVVQAIHDAAADRRYTLLLELVTTIPAAKALAEERLLVPIPDVAASAQPNLKRKAYETCANCSQEYSVESNGKGDCVHHEGKKEEDNSNDFWADHSDSKGEPEDYIDDPDFAEGFRWNCCDQNATAEGCVVSKHVPKSDHVRITRARPILAPVSANATASFRGPGGRQVMDSF